MHGDEAIPFPSLVTFLDGDKRISSRDARTVEAAGPRYLRIKIFVFVQPDRVKDSDIFLLNELGPEHTGQVLGGRDPIGKIRHVEIQVLVIEFFQHAEQNAFQIKQVDHHPRLRIDVAGYRDIEEIVMAVGRRVVAAPEDRSVLGFVPFRPVIPVGGGKFNSFGGEAQEPFSSPTSEVGMITIEMYRLCAQIGEPFLPKATGHVHRLAVAVMVHR